MLNTPKTSSNELCPTQKVVNSGQSYVEPPDFVAWFDWSELVFMLNKN
jgi:hypothetical protein